MKTTSANISWLAAAGAVFIFTCGFARPVAPPGGLPITARTIRGTGGDIPAALVRRPQADCVSQTARSGVPVRFVNARCTEGGAS